MGLYNIIKNGITIEPRHTTTAPIEVEDIEPEVEIVEEDPTAEMVSTDEPHDRREIATAILYQTTPPVEHTAPSYTTGGYNNSFQPALGGQSLYNQNILVTSLKTHDEIRPILDNLTSGNPCVVSLDEADEPQRHLDFLSGFLTAINGTIKQIDTEKLNFILTPKGVGVK